MLREHIYSIGGTAVSVILTLAAARYWALDVGILTFASLSVAQYCIRKMELPSWLRVGRPAIESRVFAYSQIFRQTKLGNPQNYVIRNEKPSFLSVKPPSLSAKELAELESNMKSAE